MTTTMESTKPGANRSPSLLTSEDLYLFNEGRHFRFYDKLGAHLMEAGTCFSVWAPNA
jgi:1,4-alpha-glucan branching enzyme